MPGHVAISFRSMIRGGGLLFPKLILAKRIDSGQISLLWTKVIENVIVIDFFDRISLLFVFPVFCLSKVDIKVWLRVYFYIDLHYFKGGQKLPAVCY